MQYITGLILKSRVEEFPLLFHFAIVLVQDNGEILVMHNTVDNDVIIETLSEYEEDRVVEDVFESDLMLYSEDELHARFLECRGDFDALNYNCEHFIDCMLGHNQQSEQIKTVLLYTAVIALSYMVFIK
tara:strand:+ start:1306 stop:1692 length:387 start_codon:yes stop_codon:yes gene_type:complete